MRQARQLLNCDGGCRLPITVMALMRLSVVITHHPLLTVYCRLLTACCSLLTVYYSLLTAYCLLLTTSVPRWGMPALAVDVVILTSVLLARASQSNLPPDQLCPASWFHIYCESKNMR